MLEPDFLGAPVVSAPSVAADSPPEHAPDSGTEIANATAPANPFAPLGLAAPLLASTDSLGFTALTPVQAQAIPLALARAPGRDAETPGALLHDLVVSSQTGSGKTLAFLLPMLQQVIEVQSEREAAQAQAWQQACDQAAERGEPPPKRQRRRNPLDPRHFRAARPLGLVLCPTRELAQQVAHEAIRVVAACKGVRIATVVGGLPYATQIARLQNASLIVATPGRLLDLARARQIELDDVRVLTLDEADRMLDLGFADDLAAIHEACAGRGQTLLFSATIAPRVQQLARTVTRAEPGAVQRLQIDAPREAHANIEQALYWADDEQHRRALLDQWLRDPAIEQAIVFASTQVECEALAGDLQQAGFAAIALHGALPQGLRNRRLAALRDGRVQFLVATDVAARGIDVPTISHVFNHGLPMKAEDYTHRIGRTGRAGRTGLAVTLAQARDTRRIHAIEAFTGQRMTVRTLAGLEPRRPPPPAMSRGPRTGGRDAHAGPRRPRSDRMDNGRPAYRDGRRDDGRDDRRDNARDSRPSHFEFRADARPSAHRPARAAHAVHGAPGRAWEHGHSARPAHDDRGHHGSRRFSGPAAAPAARPTSRKPRR